MKKAVIQAGGKQYLVAEGQQLDIELIPGSKNVVFEPLLVINDEKIVIGTPSVSGSQVKAEVVEQAVKQPKVVAIRYKAKKRVRKVRGHRQKYTTIKISTIS